MIATILPHDVSSALNDAPAGCTILSLDCFDTLLWRTTHAPTGVFTDIGSDGRGIAFAYVPAVFGMAVLFDAAADWSAALAPLLIPHHQSPLLQSMEENRLRNYLHVIELEDAWSALIAQAAAAREVQAMPAN